MENVTAALEAIAERADPADHVAIVIFGHGSFTDRARINLPRRDPSAEDFAPLLDRLGRRRVTFVNTASASGPFLEALSGEGRVVMTATPQRPRVECHALRRLFRRGVRRRRGRGGPGPQRAGVDAGGVRLRAPAGGGRLRGRGNPADRARPARRQRRRRGHGRAGSAGRGRDDGPHRVPQRGSGSRNRADGVSRRPRAAAPVPGASRDRGARRRSAGAARRRGSAGVRGRARTVVDRAGPEEPPDPATGGGEGRADPQ